MTKLNIRLLTYSLISLFLMLITSCNQDTSPSPNGNEPDSSNTPTSEKVDTDIRTYPDIHRSTTASQGYSTALLHVEEHFENAVWFGIVPFTSIERAFAIPLDSNNPSWYFRFEIPGENYEYYVEVRNGLIIAVNKVTLPDYIEPLLSELDPIEQEWSVIDNNAVLQLCIDTECPLSQYPSMVIDYRLSRPKGFDHPIWTLYNAKNLTKAIFQVDAVTGEVLISE